MSVKYADLKPEIGDSPFHVHITLDSVKRVFRAYWEMAWWGNDLVDSELFNDWKKTFKDFSSVFVNTKVKERRQSYRVQGRCLVSSMLLHDLVGFLEKDTEKVLPAKMECYVNHETKIVGIEMHIKYNCLGSWPVELLRLSTVFTSNPDYETHRPKLKFFNPSRIIRDNVIIEQSPEQVRIETIPPEAPSFNLSESEFQVDGTLDTAGEGHPYVKDGVELKS
jgi:hypothetical protein